MTTGGATGTGSLRVQADAQLMSFDGTEMCQGALAAPDRYRDLRTMLAGPGPFAVRGAGLSYCQASAAAGVVTICTRSFNRFLAFDPQRLRVTVEPGVTMGELVDFAVARGAWFPVIPGHPAITVGGCAGFNVHGKSQHNVGCFSDHVVSLTLLHPDHGELACGPTENAGILELTLGGMGLTGYIANLTLQLVPLPGPSIQRVAHPVGSLTEAAEMMRSLADQPGTGGTLYSWNDLSAVGRRFGRGLVYAESFAQRVYPRRTSYRRLAPGRRRGPQLAGATPVMRAFNASYVTRELLRSRRVYAVEDAAFPINGKEAYYRLFGRRGFREYQVIVPTAAWPETAREVERLVAAAGVPVALGSLKLFRGDPKLLWFRGDGVCLAIDVAAGDRARWLFTQLDRIAVDHGARVNLAKDSRIDASTVQAVYPGYAEFRQRLHDHDPERRFDSMLRRRIGV
jgi:decaprenylphospho-beta-D-ribofuranose 2-oxidase